MNGSSVYTRALGYKNYELTDHLGNVRAVIGDIRVNSSGLLMAELKSYANYYAFGLEMPRMNYNAYRYGYNGKEKDKEFANNYDYGFRIYNPAIAKFLSVDPLTSGYPELTPYQFASDNPIEFIDLDGLEAVRPLPIPTQPVLPIPIPFIAPQSEVAKKSPYKPKPYGLPRIQNNLRGEKPVPYRIIVDDPSKLPDWYLSEVAKRVGTGEADWNDQLYYQEHLKRLYFIKVGSEDWKTKSYAKLT